MLFLQLEDGSQFIPTLKFYCGATCLYFPLLTIIILCSDLIYQTGRFSFFPVLSLIVIFEIAKYFFINLNFKDLDKCPVRHAHKSSGGSSKKWFSEKRLKELLKSLLLLCFVTIIYYVIAVLFGAELFSKIEETLMFSILLTVLTALPPCVFLGPNHALSAMLGDYTGSVSPFCCVLQHVVRVTLLGSWLGAFVIPLDWDRPWQVWPVPCCVGALMGYVASHATAMIQVAMPQCRNTKLSLKIP